MLLWLERVVIYPIAELNRTAKARQPVAPASTFVVNERVSVTTSVGMPLHRDLSELELVCNADAALYEAKRNGDA